MVVDTAPGLPDDVELARFLDKIQPVVDLVATLAPPQAGSSLRHDDALAAPYKPSHAIRRALGASVEHLDALCCLLQVARVQHPAAPFTLMRASIETGSTALWLLTGSRTDRIERVLRLTAKDLKDQGGAEESMNLAAARPPADRRAGIQAVADRFAGRAVKLTLPTSTEIVTAAGGTTRYTGVYPAWQVCSGFAHGRQWTTIGVLDREVFEHESGDALLRVTSSTRALTWTLVTALGVINRVVRLYQLRASQLPRPL